MRGSGPGGAGRDEAVRRLREDILAGGLEPGSRVTVAGLAGRIGAEEALVRDAVGDLTQEGLIEATGHGHRIANPGPQQAIQLLDVMGVVLVALFERAAPRLSPAEIDTMAALADDLRAAIDREDMLGAYRAVGGLVTVILAAADHQELRAVNTHVLDRSLSRLHLVQHAVAYPLWADGWRETVQYLQRGRHEAAVERLRQTFWTLAEGLGQEGS